MNDRGGASRELEIKFEIDPRRLGELHSSLMRHGVSAPPLRLASTYFDTDDHTLRKGGFSWRIRKVGDQLIQTVKAQQSEAAGLHDRPEWELEVAKDQPDIDAMVGSSLADRLDLDHLRGKLKPLFRTDIERTTWRIPWNSSMVDAACDHGRVIAGEHSAEIAELELELIDGTIADLFSLARDLVSSSGAQLAATSKAGRGYELLAAEPSGAVKAEPLPITPDIGTGEAFKAVMRACIRQFLLNEPMIEAHRDVEALHQVRVAFRRLRSALSIFAPLLDEKKLAPLEASLQSLFRTLGRARNLDVHRDTMRADGTEHLVSPQLLLETAARRERAYDEAIARLTSPKCRALLLEFSALAELEPWLGHRSRRDVARRPVREFASRELERLWRQIGDLDTRLDSRERHRLRICAKTLRYGCEFFGAAFTKPKAAGRYQRFIARLGELQDVLGALNDLTTSRKLAKKGAAHSPRHEDDRGKRAKTDLLAAAAAAYASLRKTTPFW
jgi:inorganic triphosphatase YgiF